MEVICLDTGLLIEFYRSKNKKNTFLFKISQKYKFAIPTIVKYEVLRGDKIRDKFWIEFLI
ncbi:MAG: hypothetical protein B6I24_02655 [Bacteroidetes bacterium 4572_128]|nr:MAG: hypothetical protein B6I24_02655 [Bacteroidetes bacterium 4572_128]